MTSDHLFILEQDRRLSEMLIWQLQYRYYDEQGITAWSSSVIPQYISTNPMVARAYAQVALGYLRDLQQSDPPLDPEKPVYFIELGAGSGRFAFNFLRAFTHLLESSRLRSQPFRYVMTDFTRSNLDYWRSHPALQSWIQSGILDFAIFDAMTSQSLELEVSGQVLAPGTPGNPMVLIANYFFDSLPPDGYCVMNGQLYENLATLSSTQPEPDLHDISLISRAAITYRQVSAGPQLYQDPEFDSILSEYPKRLTEGRFLFPVESLRCLRRLASLANHQLLLLSGDKGYSRVTDLEGLPNPLLAVHGSISMTVNFDAIGQYVLHQGGEFLYVPNRQSMFTICAFVLGAPSGNCPETHLAFDTHLIQGGPDDFYRMTRGIAKSYDHLTVDTLLAYLRYSGWDPYLLQRCYTTLLTNLSEDLTQAEQEGLAQAVQSVWEAYYPIGEDDDLPFAIAGLLLGLKRYAEAFVFYERSLQMYGAHPSTLVNLGACALELQQPDEALEYVQQALELSPNHHAAQKLLAKLKLAGQKD